MSAKIMRRNRYNSGQWHVQRERLQVADPAPPPGFQDAVPLGSVLGGLIKRFGFEDRDWLGRLTRDWAAVVGEDVAAHSRPGRLDKTCLIVFVDSSVWFSELTRHGKPRMLQNVQKYAGAGNVNRLVLQIDPDRGA